MSTPEPVAGLAADPYDIAEVNVVISKEVNYGQACLDRSSQQELAKKVQAALKQRLTAELVPIKSQKKPARLEVVGKIGVSCGQAVSLLMLDGNRLILNDKRTEAVIASRPARYGGDFAAAAFVANASSDDGRINSVVPVFTARVKRWLGRVAAN